MEKEINLESRGNLGNKLIHVEGNKYKLYTKYSYRTGFTDGLNNIIFIDPAGGPLMRVGKEINGRKIKALHDGAIIEFEDE